jgi:quercetin dioxygenase-like cupin family protein
MMVLGERLAFRETGRDDEGEFLRYEVFYQPGGIGSRRHVHARQSERHEVLSGTLGLCAAGQQHRLSPGEAVVVPAGTPHRAFRLSEGDVHALIELRPPLQYEAIFETFAALSRAGKLTRRGYPRNPLQAAVLFAEYEDESRLVQPPRRVQRALLAPLAALGRALGYRAHLSEPGERP